MALSRSPETTAFQCWRLSIVKIFWYYIWANQINMSKLIKDYLKMLQSLVIIYQLFQ
jgi:hypothetical protein